MSMLKFSNVSTGYGPTNVLHQINLEVNPGEIVTLIGANGAGKTTLLMTIYNNPKTREGKITFDGHDLSTRPIHRISALGIALSPEGRRIFPAMSVVENLKMGAVTSTHDHLAADLHRAFELFPRLEERRHQRAGNLRLRPGHGKR